MDGERTRARDEALPIPASDLHNMNCRLAERFARVNRHHLVRLAPDDDLIARLGREVQIRRCDPYFPVCVFHAKAATDSR